MHLWTTGVHFNVNKNRLFILKVRDKDYEKRIDQWIGNSLKQAFLWRWLGHSFHHLTYESIDCSHSLSLPSLTLTGLKYIRSLAAFNKPWIYSSAKQINKQYIKPLCYCKRMILINMFVVRVAGTWSSIYKWFVLPCIKSLR